MLNASMVLEKKAVEQISFSIQCGQRSSREQNPSWERISFEGCDAPDAAGVPKSDQPYALDEAQAGVGALQHAHGARARLEHQLLRGQQRVAGAGLHAALVCAVDLVRQHVQQHLRGTRASAPAPHCRVTSSRG